MRFVPAECARTEINSKHLLWFSRFGKINKPHQREERVSLHKAVRFKGLEHRMSSPEARKGQRAVPPQLDEETLKKLDEIGRAHV